MNSMILPLFLITLTCVFVKAKMSTKLLQVVIVGGNGDLAKKYLWQGFFNLFQVKRESVTFRLYGASRGLSEVEGPKLVTILNENLKCFQPHDEICEDSKTKFINLTSYFQLKTEENYQDLGRELNTITKNFTGKEIGRVFYLSLPPNAYASVSGFIHHNCRGTENSTWMKVILEKPFGHNKKTAETMMDSMMKEFSEEEIYRVDHYLGKAVVKQVLPFRNLNRESLEPLLNNKHVDRVEISMLETVAVKGRVEFYDQYGVICDVLQNHMMEMLTLVAMDLPQNISNSSDTKNKKLKFLKQITRVKRQSILTGQYSSYITDSIEETGRQNFSSLTPTYAASVLFVNNPKWKGVPFILVSGKKLKERTSYIRIIFKTNIYQTANSGPFSMESGCVRQIVFHVEHGSKSTPGIFLSKSLQNMKMPDSIIEEEIELSDVVYQQPAKSLSFYKVKPALDAYSSIIVDIVAGKHENFVGSQHLLALWDIWSDVLNSKAMAKPRIYDHKNDYKELDFVLSGQSLKYVVPLNEPIFENYETFQPSSQYTSPLHNAAKPSEFLGGKLFINDTKSVIVTLAEMIKKRVQEAVGDRGIAHLALSGGNSPKKLFHALAEMEPEMDWRWTHIWLVDERCVYLNSEESNFNSLQDNLLNFISIPYTNIHPIPVVIAGKVCSPVDRADQLYEDTIKFHVKDGQFDIVVLGLGEDGHTASLFPNQSSLLEQQHLSVFSLSANAENSRITLTYHAINSARSVNILVTGKHKHSILHEIQSSRADGNTFPILGVKPYLGNISWYIDDHAFWG